MQIAQELKHVVKNNKHYYILEIWGLYESGKKFRLGSIFIKKHQYIKLGGQ